MAFDMEVDFERTEEVACAMGKIFDVLADVPFSAEFMPTLDSIEDLGDETYQWNIQKVGLDKWAIETVYVCAYYWDKKEGWVEWQAVEGGNAMINGRWDLEKIDAKHTRVTFTNSGTFEIPVPKIAKIIVAPIATREFEKSVNGYIDNLIEHWEAS